MTVSRGELQAELAARLGSKAEARFIVEDVLGQGHGRTGPVGHAVSPSDVDRARRLADRRVAGEPLQYVLGHWAFRSLDVAVDPRVLVPRPETEQVVEVALAELAKLGAGADGPGPVVVDLGTGSGVIALAIAAEACTAHPGLRVFATDASGDALEVARGNRQALGILDPGAAERVTLRQGAWWEAVPPALRGHVDLVVSNPPYVSEAEWPSLDAEVRLEPFGALVAPDGSDGTPGLAAVEAVLAGCAEWLARPGVAVIELSPPQAEPACAMALAAGAAEARVECDLAGRQRALVARFT
jgi:release factor glutamine methyltransferase